ncbi:MAG: PQQ-binding-like beta-propeller repeat protein [Chrysiogenetes bacterium]|nr:PQQ-binding-like beta-propeller repeat protein [Chrysiogenetes bacterium]
MARHALLVLLGALLLGGCGLPAKRGIAWSWPENLSELDTYWYAFNPDASADAPYECGSGRVARYCPKGAELPEELRLRLQARRILDGVGGFGGPAALESLIHSGDRAYFLSSDDSVYAFDASTGAVDWAIEGPLGYDCRGELVLAADRLILACRHNLGRDHSLIAFDPATGQTLATAQLDAAPAAVFARGANVGVVLGDGSLWHWAPGTDAPEMRGELPDRFHSLFDAIGTGVYEPAPTLVSDGVIYVGGATNLWALGEDLAEKWHAGLPGKAQAIVAMDERVVVLANTGQAALFEKSTGSELAQLDAGELDVNWLLASVGKSLGWELTQVAADHSGQIVFCEFRGLCLGLSADLSRLRWAGRVAERLKRNRPYVVGDRLLIEAPGGNLIVVPGLPLGTGPQSSN